MVNILQTNIILPKKKKKAMSPEINSNDINIPSPHVVRKKQCIAFCWTTPDYRDMADAQRENITKFGLEYVNLESEVDEKYKKYSSSKIWYAAKDDAFIEFITSCRGLYEQVLCVDADVSMNKPLLCRWVENDKSILWKYSAFANPALINIAISILRPEHVELLKVASQLAKNTDDYDIENEIIPAARLLKTDLHFEYLKTKRFIRSEHIVDKTKRRLPDWIDADQMSDPLLSAMIDSQGNIYFQYLHDDCTATMGYNLDFDYVFNVNLLDDHKKNLYRKSDSHKVKNWNDLQMTISPGSILFAKTLGDWLESDFQDENHMQKLYNISLQENVNFMVLGSFDEHRPRILPNEIKKIKKIATHVFLIDDWIICPGLRLFAPQDLWYDKPYVLGSSYFEV